MGIRQAAYWIFGAALLALTACHSPAPTYEQDLVKLLPTQPPKAERVGIR